MRSADPIRLGSAVSQNCSGSESVIPTLPRLITTIVQSTQMLKPKCSAKIEKERFLRAIRSPFSSQNRSSSGSQSSIQRPLRFMRLPCPFPPADDRPLPDARQGRDALNDRLGHRVGNSGGHFRHVVEN